MVCQDQSLDVVTSIVRGLPQKPANAKLQWKATPRTRASKQMRKYDAYRVFCWHTS